MRPASLWTALRPGALAALLFGGAQFVPLSAHAQADGAWLSLGTPLDRDVHSAVYDATRDRMIVFGGVAGVRRNDLWVLSLASTPGWKQMLAAGTLPSARSSHGAVYDPAHDRMIVFGGFDGGYRNDVWALSLDGEPSWLELQPAGTLPGPRSSHACVYDPLRQRMIVFGGFDGGLGGNSDQVWELTLSSTPTWNLLAPQGSAPSARARHSAIYDPAQDRILVFGGLDATGLVSDVWELTLSGTPAWNLLAPSGAPPVGRGLHRAIHDPVGQRMLVFAGHDGVDNLSDVWELTLGAAPAWTQLSPAGSAEPPRRSHSLIYDPVRQRMLSFGGSVQGDLLFKTHEVLALSLDGPLEWLRPYNEALPSPRRQHVAVLDAPRHRMVAFGGTWNGALLNDAWSLDLAQGQGWTSLSPSGPPPAGRFEHTAVYDPAGERMIVFGGLSGSGYLNDIWQLTLSGSPTWSPIAAAGVPPAARNGHTAVYDPIQERMIVFGGIAGGTVFNDVWALSLGGTPTWTQLTPSGAPPAARYWHSAIYDPPRNRMILSRGAEIGGVSFDDLWELTLSGAPAWNPIAASGSAPAARQQHSTVYDARRDRLILFGGYYFDGAHHRVNTSWALDLAGPPVWSPLAPGGDVPAGRENHTAVFDEPRDRMVVFGGNTDAGGTLNDAHALSFSLAADVPPVSPQGMSLAVRAYPVPSRAGVTFEIRLPPAAGGGTQVVISDIAGRLVRGLSASHGGDGVHRARWDGKTASGAPAPAGIYFYRVRGVAGQASGRLIKIE